MDLLHNFMEDSINSMIDQLSAFVSQVSNAALMDSFEITCRLLGGANPVYFHGVWDELTKDLNISCVFS
jgi:hypothetical protein